MHREAACSAPLILGEGAKCGLCQLMLHEAKSAVGLRHRFSLAKTAQRRLLLYSIGEPEIEEDLHVAVAESAADGFIEMQ